jgi:peptidoglycan/xylan/chitin deacetylase (PgdA/CDA1 family)
MFHYVLPADDHSTPIPNRVTLEEFRLFLDHLQENTRVLSPDEFNSYLESPRFPDACSLLTFDDGLSGHCSHVVPELARRGLKALFFVATQPLITQRMLIVHQIHCLAYATDVLPPSRGSGLSVRFVGSRGIQIRPELSNTCGREYGGH